MLKINGSHGEGGGQVLRTAVAMSMVTGKEFRIDNIRANRPNPGLSHQHLMALKAAAEIGDSEVTGIRKGSTEVTFSPSSVKGGDHDFDIGTAGSVTLMLQALIPPALVADEITTIEITGGTDVKWSPPYDYFENVFLKHIEKMGIKIISELEKRGHYPKGGGKVIVTIEPGEVKGYEVEDDIDEIRGNAFVTNLPDHIAERMKKSAEKELSDYPVTIKTESCSSPSAGTGITLWTERGRTLGCGVLGEKGVPAEKVGREAASMLKKEIESGSDVDRWSSDQLIPFLAITDDSGEIYVSEKTGHLETNIWVVNRFSEKKIRLEEVKEGYKIIY